MQLFDPSCNVASNGWQAARQAVALARASAGSSSIAPALVPQPAPLQLPNNPEPQPKPKAEAKKYAKKTRKPLVFLKVRAPQVLDLPRKSWFGHVAPLLWPAEGSKGDARRTYGSQSMDPPQAVG